MGLGVGRSDCHFITVYIEKLLVIGIFADRLWVGGSLGIKLRSLSSKACLGDSQGWVDPQINESFFQFIYHGSTDLNLQYSNYGDTFVPWKKCHQVLRIAD